MARREAQEAARRDVEKTVLHEAVRENLSTFLLECAQAGGLPHFVVRDFEKFLDCGVLAPGFARVACRECHDEILLAFSCKGRCVCPSCNARRAHDTAFHLTEQVLPVSAYRQWTLSLPMKLRFLLARDKRLLSEVLTVFMRTLFAFQRRTARRLGIAEPRVGGVAFVQRFGSALQLTPHFHVLLPEAVFEEAIDNEAPVRRVDLPRPTDADVEALVRKAALRIVRFLRKLGKLDEAVESEDALDFLRAQATRRPQPAWLDGLSPRSRGRLCAFLEGFSLHANRSIHENNRQGLLQLCQYGARGPLSNERLSQLPGGKLAYKMKRPSASGETVLVQTPVEFLRRVAALVPPPRQNLVRYFGVFAPNSRLRPQLVPRPDACSSPELATRAASPQPSRGLRDDTPRQPG